MTCAGEFDARRCELNGMHFIEASAGTGKTWNICALYVRLLLERELEVGQILVVTFTHAATAELRERLRTRIVDTLALLRSPADANASPDSLLGGLVLQAMQRKGQSADQLALRLDKALQCFDEAAIFTIHGFCQRALADVAFSAGQPFATRKIAEEDDLILQAVHDFWRRHIAASSLSPLLARYLCYRGDTPERHARLLKRHLAKPLAHCLWPTEAGSQDGPATGAGMTAAEDAFNAALGKAGSIWGAQREAIVGCVLDCLPFLHARTYKQQSVEEAAAQWDQWFACQVWPVPDPTPCRRVLFTTDRLGACIKGRANPPKHAFFTAASDLIASEKVLLDQLQQARFSLLRSMLETAVEDLRVRKREHRLVSFNDMLLLLYQALHDGRFPGLASALRAQYRAALIDEFQDTDPLQWAIFSTIYGCGDSPWFLVGDPKQAIYRFRHADLHTYLAARQHARSFHTLSHNQRSVPALIRSVNSLFSMTRSVFMLENLHYRPAEPGERARAALSDRSTTAASAQAGLWAWRLPLVLEGLPLTKRKAVALSAQATATEIARLLAQSRAGRVSLGDRRLEPSDIAVLVPVRRHASLVKRELDLLNIGCVELSRLSVFQTSDAEDVERVLLAVHEPSRETLLRTALATALLGHDAASLAGLSADEGGLLSWLDTFSAYRSIWVGQGVGVMLRRLMREQGVSARLLGRPDGERRLSNLLHLSERIHEASTTHPSPDALLRWLAAQRSVSTDDDSQLVRLESDRNLVQIITIHKSKGLEFPVVFCPFLWEGGQHSKRSGTEGREYHDDQGRAVIDFSPHDDANPAHHLIAQRIACEDASERLRLMYVALTRASARCYLVVGTYVLKATHAARNESTGSMLHWLVAGAESTPQQWFESKREASVVDAAWQTLADQLGSDFALLPLPLDRAAALRDLGPAPQTLAALAPPAPLRTGWQTTSFTGMTRQLHHEDGVIDHEMLPGVNQQPGSAALAAADWQRNPVKRDSADQAGLDRAALPLLESEDQPLGGRLDRPRRERADRAIPEELPDTDIVHFPRGTSAGTCLHAIFERVDFTDRSGWDRVVEEALLAHPQPIAADRSQASTYPGRSSDSAAAPDHLLKQMALQMLADVLHTPLVDGLILARIPRLHRRNEMAFHLPAPRLTAHGLRHALEAMDYPVPRLAFAQVEGFLQGSIDMLFLHDGRYYLIDWKSNFLGYRAEDYGRAKIEAAMREHGYYLQLLLYALASTRYLRYRLPGYRHAEHFGGVYYLFVRGVRPSWSMLDGSPAGVLFHRPTAATIDRIDLLFAHAAGAAHAG